MSARRLLHSQIRPPISLRLAPKHPQKRWQTTYFQQPPPAPKPRRRWLFGTGCFLAGYIVSAAADLAHDANQIEQLESELAHSHQGFLDAHVTHMREVRATIPFPESPLTATALLNLYSGISLVSGATVHDAKLPSNHPIEDYMTCLTVQATHDVNRHWSGFGIFDGHAGPMASHFLSNTLFEAVWSHLEANRSSDKPYTPNDPQVKSAIVNAFLQVDRTIVGDGEGFVSTQQPTPSDVAFAQLAFSGSCALLALFDSTDRVLRVANVGDSRAVLGRWDPRQAKYVAIPLSVDQTGFNADEVARLQREHPGEDVIDPQTGRLFGIAVTRAFGDSRWKWPASVTQAAYERFWGPSPRPNGVIKTPPYMTAEPEITEIEIQSANDHPDFLIMASDGLWDVFSNDDAVHCVQRWLDKFQPTAPLDMNEPRVGVLLQQETAELAEMRQNAASGQLVFPNPERGSNTNPHVDFDGAYFDKDERTLKWRVEPKYFTVQDDHCGVHLIRNALGGNRQGLVEAVMSVQPPLSRNMRDDISVQVIFFNENKINMAE